METISTEPPTAAVCRGLVEAYLDELDGRLVGLARPCRDDAEEQAFAPPHGAFVVARRAGEPVGCGGLRRLDGATAEIKRMWVAPAHRGRGLGPRLLTRLEWEAAARGYHRVVLDTNAALVEALTLYARAGYAPVRAYNANPDATHWFAKALPGHDDHADAH